MVAWLQYGFEMAMVPGQPVAFCYRLRSLSYGLLWGTVACCFGLLGFPGISSIDKAVKSSTPSSSRGQGLVLRRLISTPSVAVTKATVLIPPCMN